MKLRYISAIGLSIIFSQVTIAKETQELSKIDKQSYSIGYNYVQLLKRQGIEIELPFLIKAIEDVFYNNKPLLSEDEVKQNLQDIKKEMMAKQQEKSEQQAQINLAEGQTFLAENASKDGVVSLASGLQYKVITEGTGKTPSATDKVTTHYEGTLINGTVFDSSYKRGQPATFPVNGVIKGWTEALQLMQEGAKWQLFIPSDLAYGGRGAAGGKIGPNAILIFDIELISIAKK
ncbi:MAG: FKBP-type peptidyl-prolyl cis-trans isomerase [Thiomargarita sp.]|nr:FKBP-type peptidyl-prolyl cis-trans isomerase [Thiomargarita sp.]